MDAKAIRSAGRRGSKFVFLVSILVLRIPRESG